MKRWEYQVSYLDPGLDARLTRDDLDGWGSEGWELVAVLPQESRLAGISYAAVFKRPMVEASTGGEPAVGERVVALTS